MKVGKGITKKEIKKLQNQLPLIPEESEYKYHYYCMECLYEWESNEKRNICSYCPHCHCGDLHCWDSENNEVEF